MVSSIVGRNGMEETKEAALGIEDNYGDDLIRLYKDRANDQPDTLESQLSALQSRGV